MEYKIDTSLPIQFEKQEDLEDSRFTKVKIWLAHTGKNLNNSFISKIILENAIPSLANIPIVGYITIDNTNEKDFSGHEQRLIIEKDGITVEYLGRVYGLIPETNNALFEKKIGDDGIEREYLTCEGLLYNKFPDAIEIFERDASKGQSMELDPTSIEGKFQKDNVYHFSNFKFEAACILGSGVIPAMKGSIIEKFSISTIQSQLQEILTEFNKTFTQFSINATENNQDKGGDKMDEKLELFKNFSTLTDEEVADLKSNLDNYSLEEVEIELNKLFEAQQSLEVEIEETSSNFALTSEQLKSEIRNVLSKETYTDNWGWKSNTYWYIDHDNTRVYAQDSQDSYRFVGFNYSLEGDKVIIDFSTKKAIKFVPTDMEGDIEVNFAMVSIDYKDYEIDRNKEKVESDVTAKFEEIQIKFETLTEEIETLSQFKQDKEREEKVSIVNKFSDVPDEIKQSFIEKINEFSKDELELGLFREMEKNKINFSSQQINSNPNVITSFSDVYSKADPDLPEWADYVEQYKSKKK